MVEKTVMDGVGVQAILSDLHQATMAHTAAITRAYWDAGWATSSGFFHVIKRVPSPRFPFHRIVLQ